MMVMIETIAVRLERAFTRQSFVMLDIEFLRAKVEFCL